MPALQIILRPTGFQLFIQLCHLNYK